MHKAQEQLQFAYQNLRDILVPSRDAEMVSQIKEAIRQAYELVGQLAANNEKLEAEVKRLTLVQPQPQETEQCLGSCSQSASPS